MHSYHNAHINMMLLGLAWLLCAGYVDDVAGRRLDDPARALPRAGAPQAVRPEAPLALPPPQAASYAPRPAAHRRRGLGW